MEPNPIGVPNGWELIIAIMCPSRWILNTKEYFENGTTFIPGDNPWDNGYYKWRLL